jgi:Zn-dependent metalloprotease
MRMNYFKWVLGLIVWCLSAGLFAQEKLTKQQQADLDKAVKEAEAEMAKFKDPAYINKLFDNQIKEFKANGAATPELLNEIEKARAEMLKMAKGSGVSASPKPVAEEPDEPIETAQVAPKPVEQPLPGSYDEVQSPYSKVPASFRFYRESEVTVETFAEFMQKKYGVKLQKQATVSLPTGSEITTFQQFINEYPVFGAYFKVRHEADGKVLAASGDAFDSSRWPEFAGTIIDENQIFQKLPKEAKTSAPIYESLVIVPERLNVTAQKLHLAHQLISGKTRYYLDAYRGNIVRRESLILDCLALHNTPRNEDKKPTVTMMKTYHFGPQNIEIHFNEDSAKYILVSHNEPFVAVYDTTKRVINYPSTQWIDPRLTTEGFADAAFVGKKTIDYYKTQLGRNSFDDQGSMLIMRRAYDDDGHLEEGAYWDGTNKQIHYGNKGDKPLTSLDVIGHEFTHGVVRSGLADFVGEGESGSLNEAVADMLGTAIKHWAYPSTPDWVIAPYVFPNGIRNLKWPKTTIQSRTSLPHPNTYEGEYWQDTNGCVANDKNGNCWVHNNSTVASHWFYLLSEGGKGTNDHKQTYIIDKGIGIQKAAKLVYQTLFSLTPYTNYERFAEATVSTAEQMFGKCATETHRVKQAWYAVGVFDDAPARCMNLTFDFTYDPEPNKAIRFYVKGDSIVSVARTEDGWVKTYSERNSAFMHVVSKDEDGVQSHTLPKNWAGTIYNKMEEYEPLMEQMTEEALEKANAELRNPATLPERKAELSRVLPELEKNIAEGRKTVGETKKNLKELSDGTHLTSEKAFWKTRKAKREFDKDNVKSTYLYQGKYLAKRYVLGGGMEWVSTTEIPLRFSDLGIFVPLNTGQLRMGVDHFMRGFPLKMFGGTSIKNIKENIPANFDVLFSKSPVFN